MKRLIYCFVALSVTIGIAGCSQITDLISQEKGPTKDQSVSTTPTEKTIPSPAVSPITSNDSGQESESNQIDWSFFAPNLENQIISETMNGNCQYLDELFNTEKKQLTPDAVEPLKHNVERLLELISQSQSSAGCK